MFKNDTILITDLENIIRVYNKNKHFINNKLNLKILSIIKDNNFRNASFINKSLFDSNKKYFFDIISLQINDKKVGSIILIHDSSENLDDNFRDFLFYLLKDVN